MLTGKKPNNENVNDEKSEKRKYVIFPYGQFKIYGTVDDTQTNEHFKSLKVAEDLLKELTIRSDEEQPPENENKEPPHFVRKTTK